MPSNLLLSKYSSEYLAGIKPLRAARYPLDLWGRCPHRWQGQGPLPPAEGLRPSRCALHPRSPLGRGAGRSPAPIGIAYGAGDATRGRGFALRAPYPRGAAPCGTARTPFRCIVAAAMQLIGGTMKCQGSPRRPRSGLTLTRDRPRTLLLEGERLQGFPLLPTVSVKMGCRGLCSLLGCGAKPPIHINEVQRA